MSEDFISEQNPLEFFPRGVCSCRSCQTQLDVSECPGLSEVQCPNCGGQVLVPQQIGDFWLYAPLAVGGMGAIYKALRQDRPDKFYAVKILPRDQLQNETLIRNLQEEIRINREIGEHPCTVRVVGSGVANDEHFLATEFIDGEGLDARIIREGSVPELDLLQVALRVLSAETHIYNKGYLYRDLKPENIIISKDHGAFLCDFGICQPIDEVVGIDEGDMLQGSPLYLPPERILAEGEDAWSEIYSLGLVMYHALAGKPYYEAGEVEAVAQMHVDAHTPEEQATRMMDISLDIAEMLQRMIRRRPKDRYQTFLDAERDVFRMLVNRLYGQR